MMDLVAIGFEKTHEAARVLAELRKHSSRIDEAVVAIRDEDGTLHFSFFNPEKFQGAMWGTLLASPSATGSSDRTRSEAVEAYTLGSAYAAGQEKERGTIEVGKFADLVVLSRDILAKDDRDRIAETTVETTIVGGKVVYERKAAKSAP